MYYWRFIVISLPVFTLVNCAVIADDGEVLEEGLYKKSDNVVILNMGNFDRKVYSQEYAYLVQFYNSYCGHCRKFQPKYKSLATEIKFWKNVIRLAVLDCSIEDNNELCRQFEIMAYPSLRYLHDQYVKSNANIGYKILEMSSTEKLKAAIIHKMQEDQKMGWLASAPSLQISSYLSYADAIREVSKDVLYTFLVFEMENSTLGSELALDMNDYSHIRVKRVFDNCELAHIAGFTQSPAVVAISPSYQVKSINVKNPTKQVFIRSINKFLHSKNYQMPAREIDEGELIPDNGDKIKSSLNTDMVYYNDLEKTIKTSLHTEIPRHKILNGEPLQNLIDYLDILVTNYKFKNFGNLKVYLVKLRDTLRSKSEWSGDEVYDMVKRFEASYAPVYTTNVDYVACKGSAPNYRGYSCGLWALFHTLTINAANQPGTEGPKVLRVMHGYIKNFFGCSECSQHFQQLSAKNRLFEVQENDKAVLWLWISHNEVNLRLAGDITEDPAHPKIQFPSASHCPECRDTRGAWNLPAVFQYLKSMYGSENIKDIARFSSAAAVQSTFSKLDIGMLSLLYILSFIIIILVIKYFLTRRLYRKRVYKHGWGKV